MLMKTIWTVGLGILELCIGNTAEAVRPGDFKFCAVLYGVEYQTCIVPVVWQDTPESIKERVRNTIISYLDPITNEAGSELFDVYSEYLDRIIGRWDHVSPYEQKEDYKETEFLFGPEINYYGQKVHRSFAELRSEGIDFRIWRDIPM